MPVASAGFPRIGSLAGKRRRIKDVAMVRRATFWTVGHGNRSIEEFLALLKEAEVERLVDVRAYPASRRHPQFAREALEQSLVTAGIGYVWEGSALGGRRKPAEQSPNVALRNPGFRAYADHMMGREFQDAHERLVEIGRTRRTAVMCAERLPWQCHRFFISDYLTAHSMRVIHLIGPGAAQEHRLNSIARLRDGCLVYDRDTQLKLGI
jgi:uncharacterized protein (DUF488 family)